MPDITATQINDQLGTAAFDDNGGTGPLTLNLDTLTGDSLTLASEMAEPIFKALRAASATAAAVGNATDTYPTVTQTVQQSIDGIPKARYSASVAVSAPLNYDSITSLS